MYKATIFAIPMSFASMTALAQTTTRCSLSSSNFQGNHESLGVLSGNGMVAAFTSYANNLVPNDTNGTYDVFVRDIAASETTRVSISSSGQQSNDVSYIQDISSDGRFVAFTSAATNLVAGDTNDAFDAFVHDRQSGHTFRVSVSSSNAQGNADSGASICITPDGRFVTFTSAANNLVSGDSNGFDDIFVHDRQSGVTSRVNVSSAGMQSNDWSERSAISDDGRYVAFTSGANNLVLSDTNGQADVFVRDRQSSSTTRVSVSTGGTQTNGPAGGASISATGRYVLFSSWGTNLVMFDTNGAYDAFVHDRATGETSRISLSTSGVQGNAFSEGYSISPDGRFVGFWSEANNLISNDFNSAADAFLRDRQTGVTSLISISGIGGVQGNADSSSAYVSADGRFVGFNSWATNLITGDTNGYADMFIRDRGLFPNAPGGPVPPSQPTPEPPPPPGPNENNMIVVVHGRETTLATYNSFWVPLAQQMKAVAGPGWHAIAHNWTGLSQNQGLNQILVVAAAEGRALGRVLGMQNYDHVHLVGHSAGSAAIAHAAFFIKHPNGNPNVTSNTKVHTTYLDAYMGILLGSVTSDLYGKHADWSDHYYAREPGIDAVRGCYGALQLQCSTGQFTEQPFVRARNVDTSFLDAGYDGTCLSTHTWPRMFYWFSAGARISSGAISVEMFLIASIRQMSRINNGASA